MGDAVATWTSKNSATGHGPSRQLGHLAGLEDGIDPGIAIGVKNALEVLQMHLGMFALAIGRVEEHRGSRVPAIMGTLIAHIGPQPPGLGSALCEQFL